MMALAISLLLISPTLVAVYYVWLSWRARQAEPVPYPACPSILGILIPAHNEETILGECLDSIRRANYPPDRLRVLVIADNCRDDTVGVARRAGFPVLERRNPQQLGKGYALRQGLDQLLQSGVEAVLVLDADCQLQRETLGQLNRLLAEGHVAIQTAVHVHNAASSPSALVAAVGGEVENLLSFGFYQSGRPVHLRGTGMIFHRRVVEQHPWNAFGLTEDAEYSETLRRAGVSVLFTQQVSITTDAPISARSLSQQRSRWRESLFVDRARLLDRWLMAKPVLMLHLGVCITLALLVAVLSDTTLTLSLALGWSSALLLAWGWVFRQAMKPLKLGSSLWWNLIGAPFIVARLAGVTLLGLVQRGTLWQRTPRTARA